MKRMTEALHEGILLHGVLPLNRHLCNDEQSADAESLPRQGARNLLHRRALEPGQAPEREGELPSLREGWGRVGCGEGPVELSVAQEPRTRRRLPVGGGLFIRLKRVWRIWFENRGPIGTYSKIRSKSSMMMTDNGLLYESSKV